MSVIFTDLWAFAAAVFLILLIGNVVESCIKTWKGRR